MNFMKISEKKCLFSFTGLRRGFAQMGKGNFEKICHLLLE